MVVASILEILVCLHCCILHDVGSSEPKKFDYGLSGTSRLLAAHGFHSSGTCLAHPLQGKKRPKSQHDTTGNQSFTEMMPNQDKLRPFPSPRHVDKTFFVNNFSETLRMNSSIPNFNFQVKIRINGAGLADC
jgi:hypothetical protein